MNVRPRRPPGKPTPALLSSQPGYSARATLKTLCSRRIFRILSLSSINSDEFPDGDAERNRFPYDPSINPVRRKICFWGHVHCSPGIETIILLHWFHASGATELGGWKKLPPDAHTVAFRGVNSMGLSFSHVGIQLNFFSTPARSVNLYFPIRPCPPPNSFSWASLLEVNDISIISLLVGFFKINRPRKFHLVTYPTQKVWFQEPLESKGLLSHTYQWSTHLKVITYLVPECAR